jgi:hypothetical protein
LLSFQSRRKASTSNWPNSVTLASSALLRAAEEEEGPLLLLLLLRLVKRHTRCGRCGWAA